MRAALIAFALALAAAPAHAGSPAAVAPGRAGAPLALVERQVLTLEFDRPVARLVVTDPDLLGLRTQGPRVKVTATRAGRVSLEVGFEDGATVVYDVTVEAARRPPAVAQGPAELVLAPGEERRLRSPGLARVLVEENGVARVRAEGEQVIVLGLSPGATSLVLVDGAGLRIPWSVRVR